MIRFIQLSRTKIPTWINPRHIISITTYQGPPTWTINLMMTSIDKDFIGGPINQIITQEFNTEGSFKTELNRIINGY